MPIYNSQVSLKYELQKRLQNIKWILRIIDVTYSRRKFFASSEWEDLARFLAFHINLRFSRVIVWNKLYAYIYTIVHNVGGTRHVWSKVANLASREGGKREDIVSTNKASSCRSNDGASCDSMKKSQTRKMKKKKMKRGGKLREIAREMWKKISIFGEIPERI